MSDRQLIITLQPGWHAILRQGGDRAQVHTYQCEALSFESPGMFFSQLSEERWALVGALQDRGEIAGRELACRVGRDLKRV